MIIFNLSQCWSPPYHKGLPNIEQSLGNRCIAQPAHQPLVRLGERLPLDEVPERRWDGQRSPSGCKLKPRRRLFFDTFLERLDNDRVGSHATGESDKRGSDSFKHKWGVLKNGLHDVQHGSSRVVVQSLQATLNRRRSGGIRRNRRYVGHALDSLDELFGAIPDAIPRVEPLDQALITLEQFNARHLLGDDVGDRPSVIDVIVGFYDATVSLQSGQQRSPWISFQQ